MLNQGYSIPKSFIECAKSIQDEFAYGDKWIFLSGDSGSGRTSICEQVINHLEGKYRTIFIPCKDDMTPVQLRLLFLQQIAPDMEWDDNVPLNQSISELALPTREKILVVADDIDSVVNSFFEELMSLYEQSRGKRRLSILITAHSLWGETKLSAAKEQKLDIKEIGVPRLSLEEGQLICEQRFTFAKLDTVYRTILPKLSKKLSQCEGNISKIIKLTEILMSDPQEINNEKKDDILEKKTETPKKHNGATIFITVICIVIVLALLVPVFLGSNVVDKILGHNTKSDETVATEQVSPETASQNTKSDDPLAVSDGAVSDIKAEGPKGDKDNAVDDVGGLLDKVDEGVSVEGSKKATKNSVTLEGDTLDAIEKKEEADDKSANPRQGLAGSVGNEASKKEAEKPVASSDEKKSEAQKSQDTASNKKLVTLSRENNALYKDEIAKEDALLALKEKQKQEAFEKEQAKARAAILEQEKQMQSQAQSQSTAKESKAKTALATQKAKAKVQKPHGNPVPGSSDELKLKNPGHYTLQVLAGRNRLPLLYAADYLDGKYWIYQTKRDGKPWYVLIVGDYLTAKEAAGTARSLPGHIKKNGPFAKSFMTVQSEMSIR